MTPDDRRPGLGALIAALILSIASMAHVPWIVAAAWEDHARFAARPSDPPEAGAAITSRTRAPR